MMFNNILTFSYKINVFLNLETISEFLQVHEKSGIYREFIHLVYGRLGKNRIPLPACAYHAIRSKFPTKEKNGNCVGFVDEDMED